MWGVLVNIAALMDHAVIAARIVSDKAITTTTMLHLKSRWVRTHIIAKRRFKKRI